MTVLLHQPDNLPNADTYDRWLSIGDTPPLDLDPAKKAHGIPARLEQVFESIRALWSQIGRALQVQPTGDIAHMPTCASFGSDFGIMLAWSEICTEMSRDTQRTLIICTDPWLFRHLKQNEGVVAGRMPGLVGKELWLFLRGFLARIRLASNLLHARHKYRKCRDTVSRGGSQLLIYGHPESCRDGFDAYFGPLMSYVPGLQRLLHTDAGTEAVSRLQKPGLTATLHAWGQNIVAIKSIFVRWRPDLSVDSNRWMWLIRRAAALENSGGGPASNAWQQHCQERFLADVQPHTICWPWENHGWERALCRTAHARNVRTIGYQHTVVGPHQFNYAVTTNHDGTRSIPDTVVCNGGAYRDELAAWGVHKKALLILGAFRFKRPERDIYDPGGAIFVPLSAIRRAAEVQLAAARRFADAGFSVLIKEHPMYPLPFAESGTLKRTHTPLMEQAAVRLVLYTSGASGLDAVLAGLPAVRLQTEAFISINVLPSFIDVPATTLDTLNSVISTPPPPPETSWDRILSDPDFEGWKDLLTGDKKQQRTSSGEPNAPK